MSKIMYMQPALRLIVHLLVKIFCGLFFIFIDFLVIKSSVFEQICSAETEHLHGNWPNL